MTKNQKQKLMVNKISKIVMMSLLLVITIASCSIEKQFRQKIETKEVSVFPDKIEIRMNMEEKEIEKYRAKFKFIKIVNLEQLDYTTFVNSEDLSVLIKRVSGDQLEYELSNNQLDSLYKPLILK